MRVLWSWVLLLLILSGCEREAVPSRNMEDAGQAAGYVSVIEDLTKIMERPGAEPTTIIQSVREYVSTNRERVSEEVNTLNRTLLDMSEDDRKVYRQKATPRVEQALERYAQAQMALRKRMTEAQQWELGEALMQLR